MISFQPEYCNDINELKKYLRIGSWATFCCILDAYEIEDERQVGQLWLDILDSSDHSEYMGYTIWLSKQDMLDYYSTYDPTLYKEYMDKYAE